MLQIMAKHEEIQNKLITFIENADLDKEIDLYEIKETANFSHPNTVEKLLEDIDSYQNLIRKIKVIRTGDNRIVAIKVLSRDNKVEEINKLRIKIDKMREIINK